MLSGYAQTNIQLYNQLADRGYAGADIERVHRAYGLGTELFTGAFRGSGRLFLAHLVGTASALASVGAPTAVVVAGLLHAAYTLGEFGDGGRGMTATKRARVLRVVGEEAEDLIARYTQLTWTRTSIPVIAATVDELSDPDRRVLLIRLANEIDDHADFGMLYVAAVERRREFIQSALHHCAGIAQQLGYPGFASELVRLFEDTLTREVAATLRGRQDGSYVLAPASHTRRVRPLARRFMAGFFPQWRRVGLGRWLWLSALGRRLRTVTRNARA